MVLDLTPEQEAQIREAAAQDSRSLSDILTSTAVWLLKLEGSRDESLRLSLQQADRGEFIEEEEMQSRFGKMMQAR